MNGAVSTEVKKVLVIRVEDVAPDPQQPRTWFNPKRIAELAASIVEFGQCEEIKVVELVGDEARPGAPRYLINDGERRWRAHKLAKLPTIRAEIIGAKDSDHRFLKSFQSNFGREDHTVMESARSLKRISEMSEFKALGAGERERRLAALCSRSVEWVYTHLRLANLPLEVQVLIEGDNVSAGRLNPQVAAFLASIPGRDDQIKLAKQIVDDKLKPSAARTLIRKHIEEHGRIPGARGRKPSDNLKIFKARIANVKLNAEALLDLPMKDLRAYFEARPGSRKEILAQLDKALEALNEYKSAVAAAPAALKAV